MPSAATYTEGVKAAALFVVWLIFTGADQVRPPSVDLERAMSSWAPLLKRPSAQTAYRVPVVRSTAISGRPAPARTGAPVSGSVTATDISLEMIIGFDQVTHLSVERLTAWKNLSDG